MSLVRARNTTPETADSTPKIQSIISVPNDSFINPATGFVMKVENNESITISKEYAEADSSGVFVSWMKRTILGINRQNDRICVTHAAITISGVGASETANALTAKPIMLTTITFLVPILSATFV